MAPPQLAPSQQDGCGTFTVASWNIRNGRNGGLENACRALASLEVDITVLQETKLTGGTHTRLSSGYEIAASDAVSAHSGGVALCWRKHDLFEIEETKFFGPNVLAFQLVTRGKRFYVVGCYIPPDDLDALENIKLA